MFITQEKDADGFVLFCFVYDFSRREKRKRQNQRTFESFRNEKRFSVCRFFSFLSIDTSFFFVCSTKKNAPVKGANVLFFSARPIDPKKTFFFLRRKKKSFRFDLTSRKNVFQFHHDDFSLIRLVFFSVVFSFSLRHRRRRRRRRHNSTCFVLLNCEILLKTNIFFLFEDKRSHSNSMALKRINKELLELEKEFVETCSSFEFSSNLCCFSVLQPIAVPDPLTTICFTISISKSLQIR